MVDPGPRAAKMNQGTPWAMAGSGSQWAMAGSSPLESSWGTPLPQGGTLEAWTVKGHSGGAGSRGRSESVKLDRTRGEGELGRTSEDEGELGGTSGDEGELGGTSGDEGELGGTSGDEGELGGTGWGANSASSWDGAGSGAPGMERTWGLPAARTDASGGSNTLVISPGQRAASAGVVAILARDSGLASLARVDSGLAGMMRADSGLAGLLWGSGSAAILWQVSAVEVPMVPMVLLLRNSHGERRATQL